MRPVLHFEHGHVVYQYSRRHFMGYEQQKGNPDIPPIRGSLTDGAVHFWRRSTRLD